MRSPFSNATNNRFLDARVLIEAEKAIRAEVDHRPPLDADFPIGPHFVDDHVLEMTGGKQLRIMLDEPDQPVAAQQAGQLLHGKGGHAWILSKDWVGPWPRPGIGTRSNQKIAPRASAIGSCGILAGSA